MRHRQIGRVYRVKKDHCLVVDRGHVVQCVLGSCGWVLNAATLGFWAWSKFAHWTHWNGIRNDQRNWLLQLSHYQHLAMAEKDAWDTRNYISWLIQKGKLKYWLKTEGQTFIHNARPVLDMLDAYYVMDKGLKFTKAMTSISGFVRASLGLSDEAAWTMQQHGMTGMWQSFEPGADLPRTNLYQIVKRWPQGVGGAAFNLAATCLRGCVPFHPAAPGLHNLWTPNRLAEARVCRIPGYVFEEPRTSPLRLARRKVLRGAGRLQRHCRGEIRKVFVGARQMGKGARHAGADATLLARKRLRWLRRQWARAHQLTKASKRFRVQGAQAQAATFE
eukprot:CAMPEP_0177254606 /NCGR_PEP_ID=MMETSP0367-20130122/55876_1 /TAXON_ID=447022 ORGANISM="Scrippsiella hangoei-like, Strain SHHI-4" /NCGR_SAMPLE_ID=MMETSP0367 /ASSEMBLY_ACC=CAM_ASM_000362 /LENGTH=331 /DNA_ID=CAMNT_0018708191 /DNA_START=161 /DNA_END=1156 /DNA_ORIENTATION=+